MAPTALIFGGMGTLAECADLDRAAWNAAFRVHGVGWNWSWDTYAELMRPGGDRQLAARFADHMGVDVAAEQLDATHQRLFAARLADGLPLRAGVDAVLRWAARAGVALALVSRSETEPVRALLKATARARAGIPFDVAVLRGDVERMAPDPEGMEAALVEMSVPSASAVAVVDTPAAAEAARRAGVACLAFPGSLAETEGDPGGFPGDMPVAHVLSVAAVLEAWRGVPQAAAE